MIKLLLFSIMFIISCGNNSLSKEESNNERSQGPLYKAPDSHNIQVIDSADEYCKSEVRIDTLTTDEKNLLIKLSFENEFLIISKQVERHYHNGKLQASYLLFTKNELSELGYIYFQCKLISDESFKNIFYSYSKGQGAYGYGSIIGNDSQEYLHSFKSCGITACIIQVFENGKNIFELKQ